MIRNPYSCGPGLDSNFSILRRLNAFYDNRQTGNTMYIGNILRRKGLFSLRVNFTYPCPFAGF
ncbi:Uncharacterised protein [Salmonella enterica subsp. enterica serovar Bovismorbificans]|uniref:Uncharacterized protein n=1 Tax=Salmonella enterica subsp. enterica serovar Bovismorbificans TaxID=58097 RepID=A0A655BTJ9_SALET|nr:Uncharacterised protein [Salmonella enterica subsp. enterica serovar Bovismorbificans]